MNILIHCVPSLYIFHRYQAGGVLFEIFLQSARSAIGIVESAIESAAPDVR